MPRPRTPAVQDLAGRVEAELSAIRQREGLTREKVRTKGKAIQTLRLVDAEIARNPQMDRATAAYEAIKCACIKGVPQLELSRILVRTLNIDNFGPAGLDDRREAHWRELHLSKNTYAARERKAYSELAGVLLSRDDSPCDSPAHILLEEFIASLIDPGSPWQNAWVESFNGRMRDEHLNGQVFDSLLEAQVLTEDWRIDYNSNRPHSAHGWLTPVEFVETWLHRQPQPQLA